MKCKHETFLKSLGTPQSNREYWLITEMYTYLHGGKDFCTCSTIEQAEKNNLADYINVRRL